MKCNKFNGIWNLLTVLAMTMCMAACGGSNGGDEPATGSASVKSQSIAESAEVDAASTTELKLTYTAAVALKDAQSITLNGVAVSGVTVSNMVVTIPLSLNEGTSYTLSVAATAFSLSSNGNVQASAFTLHFTTKAAVVTNIADLTNTNATQQAKNVYAYLVSQYGKKVLSGAMGEVANALTYSNYIKTETGKYPAVVGFDYIHLAYSPANWIDYNDITPAKTQWENNGLVTYSWHWRVPSTEGETDPVKMGFGAPGKDNSTTFDIREALKTGTWQNALILKDIEKLAGYLKVLQDANIPVLWRPLHEAAGDYKWGAWFWWGAQGTQYTKQLWILLHDKLVNEYGLNNLIWVWTVQTSNEGELCTAAQIQDAYPGDAYVDIVGADLYYDDNNSHYDAFKLINDAIGGTKMVTLSECGNIFAPDKCIAGGDTWSWFMSWYDGTWVSDSYVPSFTNYNSKAIWNSIMGNANVINREDMPSLK